jgi:hypothetical protein
MGKWWKYGYSKTYGLAGAGTQTAGFRFWWYDTAGITNHLLLQKNTMVQLGQAVEIWQQLELI